MYKTVFLLFLLHVNVAHSFTGDKKWGRKKTSLALIDNFSDAPQDEVTVDGSSSPTADLLQKIQGGAVAVARKLSSAELAFAGAVATMVGDASMHPIDCIKTLQQSGEGAGLNMVSATKKIFTSGGIGGFYSGLGTYIVSDGLAGSIKFASYEAMKLWVDENVDENKKGAALFVVAGLAFVASSIVLVPGELIKQRLQMGQISSVAEGISVIWKNEGLMGFFTGYSGVCLRDVPYTMMELGIYDNLKSMYIKWKTRNSGDGSGEYKLTQWDEIIAAAITGGIIGYATAPLDNIKVS